MPYFVTELLPSGLHIRFANDDKELKEMMFVGRDKKIVQITEQQRDDLSQRTPEELVHIAQRFRRQGKL